MKLSVALTVAFVALASPGVVHGQNKPKNDDIPPSERPPAGMCRIWLDDVPAAQQPAPTDCATAVRNRPAKGRVIFGDDYKTKQGDAGGAKGNPAIKGFAPSDKKKRPLLKFP